MDNRLQATFMPRQSAVPGGGYSASRGRGSFFLLVSVIIFLLVLAAAGGLYVYKGFITKSNEKKQAQIQEEINNFEPELTKELTTLKNRMDAGKTLIDNHRAVSLLFTLLEFNTVQVLRFKDLTYLMTPEKKIQISLKGEARSYNAIAYQSDWFSKLEPLKNPMFSNLSLDDKGVVSFDFAAELDPKAVSYKSLFTGGLIAPVATTTPTTTPATSSATTTRTTSSSATTTPTTTPQTRTSTSTPRIGT